jgi:hypothetical protein
MGGWKSIRSGNSEGSDSEVPGGPTAQIGRSRRRRRLRLVALVILVAGLGFGVAPVVGDGLNQKPLPASPLSRPVVVASVPQPSAARELPAGIKLSGVAAGTGGGRTSASGQIVLSSRITKEPVVTEAGKGTFAGISCPEGYKAISGGVISGYINLLISSSSPNNPLSGKYTPRTWWLTVTNADVDGQGGSLSWRGVVNCLAPVKLKR